MGAFNQGAELIGLYDGDGESFFSTHFAAFLSGRIAGDVLTFSCFLRGLQLSQVLGSLSETSPWIASEKRP